MIVYKTRKGISMTVPEVWSMLHTMNQRYRLYCAALVKAEATISNQVEEVVEDVTTEKETTNTLTHEERVKAFKEDLNRHFNGISFNDILEID